MPLPSYRVVTQGTPAAGHTIEQVREKVRILCKYRPATLEKVFSGKAFIFKAHLDLETAEKYKAALDSTGILSSIELMPEEGNFKGTPPGAQTAICPKCGHRRQPDEAAPEWQCPRCLFAYDKFRHLHVPVSRHAAAGGTFGGKQKEGGGGLGLILRLAFIAVLLIAGYVGAAALGGVPWGPEPAVAGEAGFDQLPATPRAR